MEVVLSRIWHTFPRSGTSCSLELPVKYHYQDLATDEVVALLVLCEGDNYALDPRNCVLRFCGQHHLHPEAAHLQLRTDTSELCKGQLPVHHVSPAGSRFSHASMNLGEKLTCLFAPHFSPEDGYCQGANFIDPFCL